MIELNSVGCGTRQKNNIQCNIMSHVSKSNKLKSSVSIKKVGQKEISLSLIFGILAIIAAVLASLFIYYMVINFSRVNYLVSNRYAYKYDGYYSHIPYYQLSLDEFFPLYFYSEMGILFGSLALFFFPFIPLSIIYGVKEIKKWHKKKKNRNKAIVGIYLGGIALSEFLIFFITMFVLHL